MGGGVVLPRLVVAVALRIPRRDGRLKPPQDVRPEPRLVVVHEDGRGDVHGTHQHETFRDATLANLLGDLVGDVDDFLPRLRLEPEVMGVSRHSRSPARERGERGLRRAAGRRDLAAARFSPD